VAPLRTLTLPLLKRRLTNSGPVTPRHERSLASHTKPLTGTSTSRIYRMDSSPHRDNGQSSLSTPASTSRKRERENETPSQRHKREKAAERQRRKRERDRNNSNNTSTGRTGPNGMAAIMFSQSSHHQQQQMSQGSPPEPTGQDLSPEESARQKKVREAAKERQRKHRALVKARKLRELDMAMGNEISDVQYRDGPYQQVLAHELQHNPHGVLVHHEPPIPQEQQPPHELFASTLMLALSCAPLLKQNLLQELHMTNKDLISFQPIIAEAWDHWDRQVCL
jgi:hypothetical protein